MMRNAEWFEPIRAIIYFLTKNVILGFVPDMYFMGYMQYNIKYVLEIEEVYLVPCKKLKAEIKNFHTMVV